MISIWIKTSLGFQRKTKVTQNQFVRVCCWNKKQLRRFVTDRTIEKGHDAVIPYLLDFRKQMQMACATYAKTHIFDLVQNNHLRYTELILKYCKEYFCHYTQKELIKSDHSLALKPKKVKSQTENLWELYVRKNSY